MCNAKQLMWSFHTRNFSIHASISHDLEIDLSWDDGGEIRRQLESGQLRAFFVIVTVSLAGTVIGEEASGECIYADPREFFAEHRKSLNCTFPDMVREAVRQARRFCANVPPVRHIGFGAL